MDLMNAVKKRLLENASALEPQEGEGFLATAAKNPHGGAPERPDAQAKVAQEMGVAQRS